MRRAPPSAERSPPRPESTSVSDLGRRSFGQHSTCHRSRGLLVGIRTSRYRGGPGNLTTRVSHDDPTISLANPNETNGISERSSRRYPTRRHRGDLDGAHRGLSKAHREHLGWRDPTPRRGEGLPRLLGDGGPTAHRTPHGGVDRVRGEDPQIAPALEDGHPPDVVLEHLGERDPQ